MLHITQESKTVVNARDVEGLHPITPYLHGLLVFFNLALEWGV